MSEAFVREMTDVQGEIFGYIYMLLGDLHDARDVLQETNLVLLRKMNDFEEGSNFRAWSKRCAYFECLRFRRDRKRDRHVFDDELVALMAEESAWTARDDEMRIALRDCLAKLSERQRKLISLRYEEKIPLRQLATEANQKESAMKMTLMRIREALRVCIEAKLKEAWT